MNVQQFLEKNKSGLVTCSPDQTIKDVVILFHTHKISALPVCTDEDRLIGVISERDIMRSISELDKVALAKPVGDFMSKGVRVCRPQIPVTMAIRVMFQHRFRHLPVVGDNNELIGFISLTSAMESRLRTRKWTGGDSQAGA